MVDQSLPDVRERYRRFLRRTTETVDTRIVLQMQRIVALKLDDIFVPLTAREERRGGDGRNLPLAREMMQAAADQSPADAKLAGLTDRLSSLIQRVGDGDLLGEGGGRTRVPVEEILRDSPHNVLLGDPGSGKSTVLRWLVRRWVRDESAAGRAFLPVPVTLRYFAGWLAQNPSPGKDALAAYLAGPAWKDEGGSDAGAFGEFLSAAARDEEIILLLDGLDEALDADSRQRVMDRDP